MSDSNKASAPPDATAHNETTSTANDDQAALIEQSKSPPAPKRISTAQTVCNERNAKGKPCHGFLKQMHTGGQMSQEHLRGEDVPYKCQTCGTVYTGAPQGHLRDPERQTRYIEKELAAILRAAGGTLPAFERPQKAALPLSQHAGAPPSDSISTSTPASTNDSHTSTAQPSIGGAPVNETLAERNALFLAAEAARPQPYTARKSKLFSRTDPTAHSTSGQDSSAEADAHHPAAEAQAATGFASAAPLSPSAATASPVSGAETIADLAPDASTEQANDA